jgi:glyoxylase-like metal-dependent hydrolase (beta-lactamase superfamily II)
MALTLVRRNGFRTNGTGPAVREIAPGLGWLQLSLVNVYLVGRPGMGPWALVDTGMPTSGAQILRAATDLFGDRPPAAIVLTHGHFDHRGSARQLAEHWDVPVYAHRLELPYLTGRSDYPPPDPTVGGGSLAILGSRFFPARAVDLGDRVRELPTDGGVPGMQGWRWVHTPGHTPGHVSFFRESDGVLIVGDAFVTQKQESLIGVVSRKQGIWRPPAYFTPDWEAARRSVEELSRLDPQVVAAGHGTPMDGPEMRRQLEDLARNFGHYMPMDGRYVRQPAVADETGVVTLPPPVSDPLPLLLGLGAAALVGGAILRSRRSQA